MKSTARIVALTFIIVVSTVIIIAVGYLFKEGFFSKLKQTNTNTKQEVSVDISVVKQNILSECQKGGKEADWTTGLESSSGLQDFRKKVELVAKEVDCTYGYWWDACKLNDTNPDRCSGCSYVFYYDDGGEFIITKKGYDIKSRNNVQEVYTIKRRYIIENGQLIEGDIEGVSLDKYHPVSEVMDEIYFSERKKLLTGLNYHDRIENQLYDFYLKLGASLSVDEPISRVHEGVRDTFGGQYVSSGMAIAVYIYEDKFLVGHFGSDSMLSISQYSFDGESLEDLCQNFNAGESDYASDCSMPEGIFGATKYLDLTSETCQL